MRRGLVLRRIFVVRSPSDCIRIGSFCSNRLNRHRACLGRNHLRADVQDNGSKSGVELRAAARTNLFLAATLISGGADHPVKIRDLSATGARIETFLELEVGAAVILVRGGLSMAARVGWRADRFCGLIFESPVSMDAWIANPASLGQPPKPLRIGGDEELADAAGIAEELTRVSRWLEALGRTLASDPQLLAKHGTQLFGLGRAARTLSALAETMHAESVARPTAKREPRRS